MKTKDELKLLAQLEKSPAFRDVLKPWLQSLMIQGGLRKTEPVNEFECVRNEQRRLERIALIEKIIDYIEGAETRLDKERNM